MMTAPGGFHWDFSSLYLAPHISHLVYSRGWKLFSYGILCKKLTLFSLLGGFLSKAAQKRLEQICRNYERDFHIRRDREEFSLPQKGLEEEPEQGHFKELFSNVNRKRTAIVVGLNFFQQATGQAFASQYGTLYVKSLQTINSFNFNVINGFIGLCVIIVCLFLNDRVGRRYGSHLTIKTACC
jgi:hypothetical protein